MNSSHWAFALIALVLLASPTHAIADFKPLYADPACPQPGESVTLLALPPTSQIYAPTPNLSATITRDASTFKIVVPTGSNGFSAPQSVVPFAIGSLTRGTYVVNFYTKNFQSSPNGGPEQFVATMTFVVQANPPACDARHIIASTHDLITGMVGQPYSTPFSVQVVDAHGLPVSGVPIHWSRFLLIGQNYDPYPLADLASNATGVTDTQGVYTFSTGANGSPGLFQYRASFDYPILNPSAYFVFNNRVAPSPVPLYPVVEYYNGALDHFFITANPAEMALLDQDGSAWARRGGVFLSYSTDANARPSDAMSVCRFYGLPQAGLDSHFFSASPDECAAVVQLYGNAWELETDDAFGIDLPNLQTGACPTGTIPVHRLYNNRPDANHRYGIAPIGVLSPSYITVYGPWIPEGYGPDAVVMCAPQ